MTHHYIGRFAPSPSGPLHFGSLVTALASYLDAKHHRGLWYVRIEDIDPPREAPGASDLILVALKTHGLHWDGELRFQSQQAAFYQHLLDILSPLTYPCSCNRRRLSQLKRYDRHCFVKGAATETNHAIRLNINNETQLETMIRYQDLFQGPQQINLNQRIGDFILRRKDGLFAYQLAVVADDLQQGITHIIRGCDLLPATAGQHYLYRLLQHHLPINQQAATNVGRVPTYGHIPLVTDSHGQKLSKQNHAPPLNLNTPFENLCQALGFLQHPPPEAIIHSGQTHQLLAWAVDHWQRALIQNHGKV